MLTVNHIRSFGWDAAIRGMRNPMNSWAKSDSRFCTGDKCFYAGKCWNPLFEGKEDLCGLRKIDEKGYSTMMTAEGGFGAYILGPNDFDLAIRLIRAGPEHGKFLRMIHVQLDVCAPLYW